VGWTLEHQSLHYYLSQCGKFIPCASDCASAGEESGALLFKRELEAQIATEREEQVIAYYSTPTFSYAA